MNATHTRQGWTEAEDAQLVTLLSAGKTAREASEDLPNRSRDAVIGRAWRLKLDRPRRPQPRKRKPMEPPPMPVEPLMIPFMELNETTQCKSVEGTGPDGLATYCGHPRKEGSSYCPHHSTIYEYLAPAQPRQSFARNWRAA